MRGVRVAAPPAPAARPRGPLGGRGARARRGPLPCGAFVIPCMRLCDESNRKARLPAPRYDLGLLYSHVTTMSGSAQVSSLTDATSVVTLPRATQSTLLAGASIQTTRVDTAAHTLL